MLRLDEDDDRPQHMGGYKVPDRDYYRKNFCSFPSVVKHFENKLYCRSFKERRWAQPHYSALVDITTPYSNLLNPADGVCCHFLRKGFTKPTKVLFNCALWSADARWLVLATQAGDFVLWESEALKVHKLISVPAHKEVVDGDVVKAQYPITAMAWKHFGNLIATGDNRGLIQYCDETFRTASVTKDAHAGAVRGLAFSPLDTKLASCSDDATIKLWSGGRDKPELELLGHKQDIKCIDWHPFRSLIATGSRDTTVKLWDPKANSCVSTISCSERQVNCCHWNMNGNWLATGSTDGFVRVYDIRTMNETDSWRIHQGEDSVCRIAWHPIHESLLVSGTFNGTLAYWIAGQSESNLPHSLIRDAHKLSIDVLAWHPSGNVLASTSHDLILKFWCREPPGSSLENISSENQLDNAPVYFHGPLDSDAQIPPVRNPTISTASQAQAITQPQRMTFTGQRPPPGANYPRDFSRNGERRFDPNSRKRPRDITPGANKGF